MKLPNGNNALVSKEKLTGYLLSETHAVGKAKAKFFRKLGFNESNVNKFEKSLLNIAKRNEIKNVKEFTYGINYVLEGKIKTPSRKIITLVTVWFTKTKGGRPSFVTAYPV
ncbi:hypothetical protein HY383_03865 [Candidatus Daviesbacteria bacterium]|nr:hypothetical protein [Candidatus Daviesbacteria bacterium]